MEVSSILMVVECVFDHVQLALWCWEEGRLRLSAFCQFTWFSLVVIFFSIPDYYLSPELELG